MRKVGSILIKTIKIILTTDIQVDITIEQVRFGIMVIIHNYLYLSLQKQN